MEFRIADTFTESLSKLTGQEQKAVKTTAFDLQTNPASPGLRFHRLDNCRDPNFWSISASLDIRLIIHKTESSILLCYVDHHDKAYDWARRRKVETHPKTGAAQMVEVRETIKEIIIPKYTEQKQIARPKPPLFATNSEEELLSYGVPAEWIEDVKKANEDSLLELADHLPSEAAEALLDLATGKKPQGIHSTAETKDPFEHPDAQRRFRTMRNVEELERALEYPWEKWSVFLHPDQQQIIEKNFNGPARVSGSAGTGKTIVALHRAVFLARSNPDARVLLATFSNVLANALRNKLKVLLHHSPRIGERLEIYSMDELGRRLYKLNIGNFKIATDIEIKRLLEEAISKVSDNKFTNQFLYSEWVNVVDAWQLKTWDSYRDVSRLGRKTRLPEKQRAVLWSIFEYISASLEQRKLLTYSNLFTKLSEKISHSKNRPFDFAVIDEAQDINVAQLRFLSALGATCDNCLFFAGDLGQRIFQQPFSWKELGVDIRGRSKTLRINYRTSHQIRIQADRLLGPEMSDVDGNVENRKGTISVFNGPSPAIKVFNSKEEEILKVSDWIKERMTEGVIPHELGVFVRSSAELDRAKESVRKAGQTFKVLDEIVETTPGHVAIGAMHLSKGLEFRAVAVMACDDEVIPLQKRIESVTDDADLEEVYNTERQLLYVACTRARDHLLVTGEKPGSEFLDDLKL
jgi:mRNA-degrading endonuclease RelE of RelBE toxin-antitoxin system